MQIQIEEHQPLFVAHCATKDLALYKNKLLHETIRLHSTLNFQQELKMKKSLMKMIYVN